MKKVKLEICRYINSYLDDMLLFLNFDKKFFLEQLIIYPNDLINLFIKAYFIFYYSRNEENFKIENFDEKFVDELILEAENFLSIFYLNLDHFFKMKKENCFKKENKKINIRLYCNNSFFWNLIKNKSFIDDYGVVYKSSFFDYFKNVNGVFSVNLFFEFYLYFLINSFLTLKDKIGYFELERLIDDISFNLKEKEISLGIFRKEDYYKFEAFFIVMLAFIFGRIYTIELNFLGLDKLFLDKTLKVEKRINDIFNKIKIKHKRDFKNIKLKKCIIQYYQFEKKE